MPPGGSTRLRVEQVREQLGAVDQARAGARVGGGGVDGEDAPGAERVDPVAVLERLGARSPRRTSRRA